MLIRHLTIFVMLKFVALFLLWWFFVKEERVHVDADSLFEKFSTQQTMEAPTP